jgi:nucleoid DNA-binding protein
MISEARKRELFDVVKSINKNKLVQLTKERLPQIKKDHIHSVINILFDQLENDLIKDKKLIIGNFFHFSLSTIAPKRARNYYTGEIIITKPFNKVKLVLDKKFAKKLIKYLDVDSYLKSK